MAVAIVSIMLLLLAVGLLVASVSFLLPIVGSAPFVPTKRDRLATIMAMANVSPGQRAVDLGSGNGNIVITLARAGAIAHGYEINPLLVMWSRWRIRRAGLADTATIYRQSLWLANLTDYDVVVIYGLPSMMPRLAEKLRRELKPGAKMISNAFHIPGWSYQRHDNHVFLYIK